jgi:hypothetical protein
MIPAMTIIDVPHGQSGGESFFTDIVPLSHREVLQLLAGMEAVTRRLARLPAGGAAALQLGAATAAFRRRLAPGALCPKEAALDLAAELLSIADRLMSDHRCLEGFAVEGVQGRLVEALVGSGRDLEATTGGAAPGTASGSVGGDG